MAKCWSEYAVSTVILCFSEYLLTYYLIKRILYTVQCKNGYKIYKVHPGCRIKAAEHAPVRPLGTCLNFRISVVSPENSSADVFASLFQRSSAGERTTTFPIVHSRILRDVFPLL